MHVKSVSNQFGHIKSNNKFNDHLNSCLFLSKSNLASKLYNILLSMQTEHVHN